MTDAHDAAQPEDKWAHRQAMRRAAAGQSVASEPPQPAAPRCITLSVVLWRAQAGVLLLFGITSLFGFAAEAIWAWIACLFVVLGAANLRAGFRGPRYVLSIGAIFVVISVWDLLFAGAAFGSQAWLPILVSIIMVGVTVPATILMWMPAATHYIHQMHQYRVDAVGRG